MNLVAPFVKSRSWKNVDLVFTTDVNIATGAGNGEIIAIFPNEQNFENSATGTADLDVGFAHDKDFAQFGNGECHEMATWLPDAQTGPFPVVCEDANSRFGDIWDKDFPIEFGQDVEIGKIPQKTLSDEATILIIHLHKIRTGNKDRFFRDANMIEKQAIRFD